jgi:hypothetical protein
MQWNFNLDGTPFFVLMEEISPFMPEVAIFGIWA